MIKSQTGLKKTVERIQHYKKSIKNLIEKQKEKLIPHKKRIEKIKKETQPNIEALQKEEQKNKEAIYQYISENDYQKIPGLSIRSSIEGEITDKRKLIRWLLSKDFLDTIAIDQKTLNNKIKETDDPKDIPGYEMFIKNTIVISQTKA